MYLDRTGIYTSSFEIKYEEYQLVDLQYHTFNTYVKYLCYEMLFNHVYEGNV